jgi:hypothetical protein
MRHAESADSSADPRRELVVVVHGVGDQKPGTTVADFARARAKHVGTDLDDVEQVRWFREEAAGGRDPEAKFSSHRWRLRHGDDETIFAEVFWADLSGVPSGKLGAAVGLLQVIFGLHHVAGHAAWAGARNPEVHKVPPGAQRRQRFKIRLRGFQSSPGVLALVGLARAVALTLRGPVAATTLHLTVAVAMTAVLSRLDAQHHGGPLLAALGALGVAGGWLFLRSNRGQPERRSVAFWTALLSLYPILLALVASGLRHGRLAGTLPAWWNEKTQLRMHGEAFAEPTFGGDWYCLALWDLLVGLLAFVALLLLAMAVAWALVALRARSRVRPALAASYLATALSTGLFFLAFPTMVVIVGQLAPDWLKLESPLPIPQVGPLLVAWGAALAVMLAVAFTLFLRWLWRKRNPDYGQWIERQRGVGKRPRPLILGGVISWALVLLSVAGSLLFVTMVLVYFFLLFGPETAGEIVDRAHKALETNQWLRWGLEMIRQIKGWIGLAIGFIGTVGLGALLIKTLRTMLDIALDVINHFRYEWSQEPGDKRARERFRRNRIRGRLRTVLGEFADPEKPRRLTIVAHSQGTITALDELCDEDTRKLLGDYCHKALVTMGSPLSHLYQHYFPNEYGFPGEYESHRKYRLSGRGPYRTLEEDLDRWLNLFRVGDFVGTHIEWQGRAAEDLAEQQAWPGRWPENRDLGRGGHLDYWQDPRVHQALDEVLLISPGIARAWGEPMSTDTARPARVAIIGASGTYGSGILARAEEIGVDAVVVTRSPHKFKKVKSTTSVVETQLDEEQKLTAAFRGCDGVISALGDDRKERPKTHCLPHVWRAMKAAGVTKYIGMASGAMMMPGERRGGLQRAVHPLLSVLKQFGVDMLEQNEWERDSLLTGQNGAEGITWVITRVVRPTKSPFVGAYAHRDERGPLDCSIYDHGDFCLYCVASSEWDELAPHVSSGPPV